MIKIDHVTYRYDEEHTALKDISLEINKGEMLVIVGHNGSGKSTLAKHLNALLLPTEGRVEVDGMDTAVEANTLNIRKKVGMVFQNPDNQIVTTIVEEDVAFGPENLGVPPEEIRRRVNESLKAVGMEKYARSAPHMLSGGQKQRIAIAGMLAMEPEVLVLDEATAMLDPSGAAGGAGYSRPPEQGARHDGSDDNAIHGRGAVSRPGDSYGRRKADSPGYAERGIQQGEGTPGQRP